jgi:single-strand DNA-binding protein
MPASVSFVGNITRDPELRFGQSGKAFLKFSVAVNENKKGLDGEWETTASYFDCTAFNELAENLAQSVAKGTRVMVTGRIKQENWTDKETQQPRSKLAVTVDEAAPSLRYATAVITKTERPEGGNQGGNRGGGRGEREVRNDNSFYDEEPF